MSCPCVGLVSWFQSQFARKRGIACDQSQPAGPKAITRFCEALRRVLNVRFGSVDGTVQKMLTPQAQAAGNSWEIMRAKLDLFVACPSPKPMLGVATAARQASITSLSTLGGLIEAMVDKYHKADGKRKVDEHSIPAVSASTSSQDYLLSLVMPSSGKCLKIARKKAPEARNLACPVARIQYNQIPPGEMGSWAPLASSQSSYHTP